MSSDREEFSPEEEEQMIQRVPPTLVPLQRGGDSAQKREFDREMGKHFGKGGATPCLAEDGTPLRDIFNQSTQENNPQHEHDRRKRQAVRNLLR